MDVVAEAEGRDEVPGQADADLAQVRVRGLDEDQDLVRGQVRD
jgi:hypothetical protein